MHACMYVCIQKYIDIDTPLRWDYGHSAGHCGGPATEQSSWIGAPAIHEAQIPMVWFTVLRSLITADDRNPA